MPSVTPTLDSVTASEEQDFRDNAIDAQLAEETRQRAVSEYMTSIKQSLLFRPFCNWTELLSAIPLAISSSGALFLAASDPDAQAIQHVAPRDGFIFLPNFTRQDLTLGCSSGPMRNRVHNSIDYFLRLYGCHCTQGAGNFPQYE